MGFEELRMKTSQVLGAALLLLVSLQVPARTSQSTTLRFEVTIAPGLSSSPQSGRLFVVMSPKSQPEPRLTIGQTGLDASRMLGRDIRRLCARRYRIARRNL